MASGCPGDNALAPAAQRPAVGLLGLYLELYDRVLPGARARIDAFYAAIASALEERGLRVVRAPVCRVEDEFREAVRRFESERADAVVTLHLAYSPSLESADVLAATRLPVIVLDTTPAPDYGPQQDPEELMYNHGIHGVQDLCNILLRRGKGFLIEAGHWQASDVLDRVAARARGAAMAARMRAVRVGTVGGAFRGMGDFQVPEDILSGSAGITVVRADFAHLRALLPSDDDPAVIAEMEADRRRFDTEGLDEAVHRSSVRASLAVRRWMEEESLGAFTMNFAGIDRSTGLPAVPFLEASKAMARGVGYAGEGDVLTAAFVHALAGVHPRTTFTEMFCPDWKGGTVFLSHMAEMNPDLASGKARLVAREMAWIDAGTPAVTIGRFQSGGAVFVNLAPGRDGTFTLIAVPVEVTGEDGEDRMRDAIRGWIRPEVPLEHLLERYSRLGGTHHAALVYGDVVNDVASFGSFMGWRVEVIGRP